MNEPEKSQKARDRRHLASTRQYKSIRSYLKRHAQQILSSVYRGLPIVGSDGYNISELMKLKAAMDTAEYCIKHLPRTPRLHTSLDLFSHALRQVTIGGLYLEFGVATARAINHIAGPVRHTVHGFDSFEGLPEDWRSGFPQGQFAQEQIPRVRANVELHVGLFGDTLPAFLQGQDEPVAFLHVDCDLYSSTKVIFNALSPRILAGTVIVFDEYFNHPTWRTDEWLAFQQFMAERSTTYDYIGYVPTHQQAAVIIHSPSVALAVPDANAGFCFQPTGPERIPAPPMHNLSPS